jgi:hypothetical protein
MPDVKWQPCSNPSECDRIAHGGDDGALGRVRVNQVYAPRGAQAGRRRM